MGKPRHGSPVMSLKAPQITCSRAGIWTWVLDQNPCTWPQPSILFCVHLQDFIFFPLLEFFPSINREGDDLTHYLKGFCLTGPLDLSCEFSLDTRKCGHVGWEVGIKKSDLPHQGTPLRHLCFWLPQNLAWGKNGGMRCRIQQHNIAFIKHLLYTRPMIWFTDKNRDLEKSSLTCLGLNSIEVGEPGFEWGLPSSDIRFIASTFHDPGLH